MTTVPRIESALIIADGEGGWYANPSMGPFAGDAGFPMPDAGDAGEAGWKARADAGLTDPPCAVLGTSHPYVCTRPLHHRGRHGASNREVLLAQWI